MHQAGSCDFCYLTVAVTKIPLSRKEQLRLGLQLALLLANSNPFGSFVVHMLYVLSKITYLKLTRILKSIKTHLNKLSILCRQLEIKPRQSQPLPKIKDHSNQLYIISNLYLLIKAFYHLNSTRIKSYILPPKLFITLLMILSKLPTFKNIIFTSLYFNHYQTLNLTHTATDQEIKASFLSLAKKYHPDSASTINSQQFIKIKQAYDILKQPNSRKNYDLQIFPQKLQEQIQNFYFYRAAQFQENHRRKKNQQKRKVNFIINSLIFISFTGFLVNTVDFKSLLKPLTLHEIRRQNIILANQNIDDGPAAQERRKQQYAQQMKEKKIYGSVIQLKVRGAGQQTTKAKQKRLQGIISIEGVQKQKILDMSAYTDKQQYM